MSGKISATCSAQEAVKGNGSTAVTLHLGQVQDKHIRHHEVSTALVKVGATPTFPAVQTCHRAALTHKQATSYRMKSLCNLFISIFGRWEPPHAREVLSSHVGDRRITTALRVEVANCRSRRIYIQQPVRRSTNPKSKKRKQTLSNRLRGLKFSHTISTQERGTRIRCLEMRSGGENAKMYGCYCLNY